MSEYATELCEQCGSVDDHPKHHYGSATYHYDCLPFAARQAVAGNGLITAITAAAEDGTHGDELRAHVVALTAEDETHA